MLKKTLSTILMVTAALLATPAVVYAQDTSAAKRQIIGVGQSIHQHGASQPVTAQGLRRQSPKTPKTLCLQNAHRRAICGRC